MVRVLPWTGLVGKLNTVGINLQDAYNVGVCGAHHMKSYLIKRMINVRREMLGLVEVCHYSRNDAVRKKKNITSLHRINTHKTTSEACVQVECLCAIIYRVSQMSLYIREIKHLLAKLSFS